MEKLTFNPGNLTVKCGNKVTQYKDKHAFKTAWLHASIRATHWSYEHYTKRYNELNKREVHNA